MSLNSKNNNSIHGEERVMNLPLENKLYSDEMPMSGCSATDDEQVGHSISPLKNQLYSDEISFKDIILKSKELCSYLISKWKLVSLISLLCASLGLVYALLSKPDYEAELTFVLEQEGKANTGGSLAGLAAQFGLAGTASSGGLFQDENIMYLMKSRSMIAKTLLSTVNINGKKQQLIDLYMNFNGFETQNNPNLVNIQFKGNPSHFTVTQDSIIGIFHRAITENNLIVGKVDKKLNIISVKFQSKNELFSKVFVEKLVSNVAEFYTSTKTKRTLSNLVLLESKADSLRKALNLNISGVANAYDLNPNLVRMSLRVPSQKKQIDVQILTTAYVEVVRNLETTKFALQKETPLIQVVDEPILPLKKNKIRKLYALLIGGFLGGFLTSLFLIFRNNYKNLMK